jgi:putative CocE/NonD family hydrolase
MRNSKGSSVHDDEGTPGSRNITRRRILHASGFTAAAVTAGLALGSGRPGPLTASAAASSRPNSTRVMVPLRDGVKVAGDLYLPGHGDRFPVLLEHTPYDRAPEASTAGGYTASGYGVLVVSSRGIHDSQGTWTPYTTAAADGFDIQEWIARQPWCDGNIGMFGHSYPGFAQLLSAPYRSKAVKALNPSGAQTGNFSAIWSREGIYQLALGPGWGTSQQALAEGRRLPALDWTTLLAHLPLGTLADEIHRKSGVYSTFVRDTIAHPNYDDFWRRMSIADKYGEMDVPALHDTGWYDDLTRDTFNNYEHLRRQARSARSRRMQYLLVGPWGHSTGADPQRVFGDVDFGPGIHSVDVQDIRTRWFDYFLKGKANALDGIAPVTIFVMGANEWRTAPTWPLPGTHPVRLYLGSGDGTANSSSGSGYLGLKRPGRDAPDTYEYDPRNPVATNGGNGCCPVVSAPIGPYDQRRVEARNDVLVYTTEPLARDVEVTGRAEMKLYFSTNVPDTDFFVTLTDVYPDGRSITVTSASLRTRFRNSLSNPELLTPGHVYCVGMTVWETSNVFRRGHRIRVDITSSNFPRFNRNLNSGKSLGDETADDIRVATQVIYHDQSRPSSIVLPVVPPHDSIIC